MKYVRILFALCLVVGLCTEAPGQRPTEYEVKAAFLYNFARFVTWPDRAFADKESPLVIGVLPSILTVASRPDRSAAPGLVSDGP